MLFFAQIALIGWPAIALVIFALLPARRAAVVTMVAGWLFLPNLLIEIAGLPDYSKYTAAGLSVFLGACLFDGGRLLSFRPNWYDLPLGVWIVGIFSTSISNGLGYYEAMATAVNTIITVALPYIVGRVYLADREGITEFALGCLAGGLVYLPLCLYESKFSPQLELRVYGLVTSYWMAPRFGLGYRPVVFLGTGLATGMYMCGAGLAAYWCWVGRAYRRFWGQSAGMVAVLLLFGAVMTKSLGALETLLLEIAALYLGRRLKTPVFLLIVALLPVLYMGVRIPNIWTGSQMVEFTDTYFGPERASSISTRLYAEDLLVEKALERPYLGWGGYGRNRPTNAAGQEIVVTDGLWIIVFGTQGLVGLSALTAFFILPVLRLAWKVPVARWDDPEVAAAAAVAIVQVMFLMDCLSNAMVSPIYYMAAGTLVSFTPRHLGRSRREAEASIGATAAPEHAGEAWGERPEAVLDAWRHSLAHWNERAAATPDDPVCQDGLASALEGLGRALQSFDRREESAQEWRAAVDVRERLAVRFPDVGAVVERWAESLNDFAWSLANRPDRTAEEVARAVALAEQAVAIAPRSPVFWNTLGTVLYHAGDWPRAVAALGDSAALNDGGTSFDLFPLAMSYVRLGEPGAAAECYQRAVAWMVAHHPDHPDLIHLRAEAAALLSSAIESPLA